MNSRTPNNEVLVVINEACCLIECIFRDGVSENIFDTFTRYYGSLPGYSINYGTDVSQGGYDKSNLVVHYNRAKHYSAVVKNLEQLLKDELRFKHISWKRNIDYGTKQSNVLTEVC
jgi:hypothetical protein